MIWPAVGTGERLAALLRDAAMSGENCTNGRGDEVIVNYLEWVGSQVRMLQSVLPPHDLDRLLTSPRYWAVLDNPVPTSTIVASVIEEVQFRVRLLSAAAEAVSSEVQAWRPRSGKFTNLVVPDTNFWMNVDQPLSTFDWQDLLESSPGPSFPSSGDEIRVVIPLLVIDELDHLGHRSDKRAKVNGVSKYLYGLLGDQPGVTQFIRQRSAGHGELTMQLLFEPLGHVRLSNNDDELVERAAVLRDFLGHPAQQVFFVTHDAGAAFRATNRGLMTRHLATPAR